MIIKLPSLLTLLLLVQSLLPGDPAIQKITTRLEKFRKNYPQEKIHLHVDKPVYSIGDTIYFKAYLVNAEKNLPSVISNILYVDLADGNDQVKKTLLLPVSDGITWGTIGLSDSLQPGHYKLRAYTNWMRNFDQAYFFNDEIEIGNALNDQIEMNAICSVDNTGINNNTAVISFIKAKGKEVINSEVNYALLLNNKEISSGKARTNNKGSFSVDISQFQRSQVYELVTNIKIDKKNFVEKKTTFTIPAKLYSTQFFPEGGQMVNNLPAHVGFKALDANGLGIDVSGEVMDESGNKVAGFKSGFTGIGSFTFTPVTGNNYLVTVKYSDGYQEKIALPRANTTGYVLTIDNTSETKSGIAISAKGTVGNELVLVAQSNNVLLAAEKISLVKGQAVTSISKEKLPTGIIQFTLFDARAMPVAERLAFINHNDHLQINLTTASTIYSKREKVQLTLEVKDDAGDPVEGSFSISVTPGDILPAGKKRQTILGNLLLASDLRGAIEDPGYYFTDINKDKTKALDDLLLTQGWRRFHWKELLEDRYPKTTFKVQKNLTVSGKVLTLKGEPVPAAKVSLVSKKGSGYVLDTITNSGGTFLFDELNFTENMNFAIQATTASGSRDVSIEMDEFFSPAVEQSTGVSFVNHRADSTLQLYLKHSRQRFDEMKKNGLMNEDDHLLKEVIVKTKEITNLEKILAPSANLNGPGNADQVFTYLDMNNCSDLAICLAGKIRGVTFKMVVISGKTCVIPYSTMGMGKPMIVVLDGQVMSGADGAFSIKDLTVGDIQSIEVLRTGGYTGVYGFQGSGGVLVITTKRGGIDYNPTDERRKLNNIPSPGMRFISTNGYAVTREFYAPVYSSPATTGMIPDLRSTIYWQPNIVTDSDGKASIEFYNADLTGNYNVVLEGISTEGKIGVTTLTYEVKK